MVDRCRLCSVLAPLVPKSHVIPQWMFYGLPQDERRFRIASSYPGEFEQRSQTGLYGTFVCQSCENRFAALDDYAAQVLRRNPRSCNRGLAFGSYDFGRLARFYLSVLWRMNACTHRFFDSVTLDGDEERVAKALLIDGDASLSNFDIVPTWSEHALSLGLLTPKRVTVDSIPHWQVYLPRFQGLIKTSDYPGSACLQDWKMAPGVGLCMLEKSFNEFGEVALAERVFKMNMEKKNAKRG